MEHDAGQGRGSRMAMCLWWRGFELELERGRTPSLAERPLALSEAGDGRRVAAACARAAACGVEQGMIASQAIALCPELALREPDPEFHDAACEQVLEVLRGWSPVVERSAERGRTFVGMDGLERLHGPPRRQVAGVRRRLSALSPRLAAAARAGCAPGKFAAWVAARSAAPGGAACVAEEELGAWLAPQPVEVLPVSPCVTGRLRRLGIARLGQLARMPEQALAAQFGAEGRRALAWARGERVDRVRPEPPPEPIRVALDFPAPLGQLELLHAALDHLVARALRHPRRRGKSVRGLRVSASLEGGGSWSVRAIARDPTSDAARLGAFLRSRIALDRPRRAVEALGLELFRFGPASVQAGLFDPRRGAPRARGSLETSEGELLPAVRRAARLLRLRLGGAALYRVLELEPESRLPERRHALMELA